MIEIKNLQKRITIRPAPTTRIARKILAREGVQDVQLTIVFVPNRIIKSLNRKFLKHAYATDVLAFDWQETGQKRKKSLNGEIVISTDMVLTNARRFKTDARQELILYIIHGILHLLGYDDGDKQNREKMRKKEHSLLRHVLR